MSDSLPADGDSGLEVATSAVGTSLGVRILFACGWALLALAVLMSFGGFLPHWVPLVSEFLDLLSYWFAAPALLFFALVLAASVCGLLGRRLDPRRRRAWLAMAWIPWVVLAVWIIAVIDAFSSPETSYPRLPIVASGEYRYTDDFEDGDTYLDVWNEAESSAEVSEGRYWLTVSSPRILMRSWVELPKLIDGDAVTEVAVEATFDLVDGSPQDPVGLAVTMAGENSYTFLVSSAGGARLTRGDLKCGAEPIAFDGTAALRLEVRDATVVGLVDGQPVVTCTDAESRDFEQAAVVLASDHAPATVAVDDLTIVAK